MAGDSRKIVVLAERYSDTYEDISIQRQGWTGRNKLTGVTEVLPVNAFQLVGLEQLVRPTLERMAREMIEGLAAEYAESGIKVEVNPDVLENLAALREDQMLEDESEADEDPGEPEAQV